jgi:hypothetical protein
LALLHGTAAIALSPADKCEAAKNKLAGKYSFCRQKTLAKAIRTGARPEYSQCDTKLLEKWVRAEQKAFDTGTPCKDSVGGPEVQSYLILNSEILAAALAGIGALGCPLPATGQTTAYGTGSDGDLQKGASQSFTDNGDGTITDNRTGLMWEKKSDDGTIHDKDNTYKWCQDTSPADFFCDTAGDPMDGTIVTTFLAALNGGGGFAGHTDWRVPNRNELQSILNLENENPAVGSAFNTGCVAACTVTTCSCTGSMAIIYWSSTTQRDIPRNAWLVAFDVGYVSAASKTTDGIGVRAVRGGS